MQIDPTLTIEGLITAVGIIIGVLGAVIGFLIDLSRRRSAERKDKRERADRLTIMEILERDVVNGMTEAEIVEAFGSEEMASFRKRAGATQPSKLKGEDYSRYLRDLQWSFMIDQLEVDRFRLRTKIGDRLHEERELRRQLMQDGIRSYVSEDEIVAALTSHFGELSEYEKSDALGILVSLGALDILDDLAGDLRSGDASKSLAAARLLARSLHG